METQVFIRSGATVRSSDASIHPEGIGHWRKPHTQIGSLVEMAAGHHLHQRGPGVIHECDRCSLQPGLQRVGMSTTQNAVCRVLS